MKENHYKYLETNFPVICFALGLPDLSGLISAHGDKCYSYKNFWRENGISFNHGVAIYLLSYVSPFSKEVRETNSGWVDPKHWVVSQYEKIKPFLP